MEQENEVKPKQKFIGCNVLAFGCLFFIIAICFLILAIFFLKPDFIWNPVAKYFNNGLELTQNPNTDLDFAQSQIEQLVKESSIQNKQVKIHQDQLTTVAKNSLTKFPNAQVKILHNELYLYWHMLGVQKEKPVYGYAKFVKDAGEIKLDSFGSIKLNFKGGIFNSLIQNAISTISSEQILSSILGTEQGKLTFEQIEFENENLILKTDINFSLYD